MEKRTCPECGEVISGRIDKKFCSDMCRNAFNNKQNSDATNYIRNVNNILRKNRRILEGSLKGETTNISKQKLLDKGLNFTYFTDLKVTPHTYYFCYEYGYRFLENDVIMIVKKFES